MSEHTAEEQAMPPSRVRVDSAARLDALERAVADLRESLEGVEFLLAEVLAARPGPIARRRQPAHAVVPPDTARTPAPTQPTERSQS